VHIFMDQVQENDNHVTSCYVDSIYYISDEVINGLDSAHFTECSKNSYYVLRRNVDAFLRLLSQCGENHRN